MSFGKLNRIRCVIEEKEISEDESMKTTNQDGQNKTNKVIS